ncbi:MAG: phosphoglycolate phosphatase [Oleiphilaceae bacterium]|nr:phosphoglycolate phosphatase [Oleiphilaceae bacterium]
MSLNPWPDAILLDLDGTLVDSAPDLAMAVDTMLTALGRPAAGVDRVRLWVGNGARKLIERALAGTGDPQADGNDGPQTPHSEALFQQAREAFFTAYRRCNGHSSKLYPGVAAFLREAKARGSHLAVVTNKPAEFTGPLLKAMGIEGDFEAVISGDTLTDSDGEPVRKPDPAPLREALRQLGIATEKALMVGDSRADMDAARALGLPVAAVTYGYSQGTPVALLGPDHVVDSLTELL